MRLRDWDALPPEMQNDAVKKYYDILSQRKTSLFFIRVFDIAVSLLALILLSPLFLILSAAIAADTRGGVFFRQVRVTQYGKEFRIYKFRTMVANAEQIGSQVTMQNDMRVTRVGKIIRKSRLDEIPQLINILKGEMSFVGTRPEVPKYVAAYTDEMMATLLLPAGVTSKASIAYKDEDRLLSDAQNVDETYVRVILPKKMAYNLEMIENTDFFGNIKIMLMTVFAVTKPERKSAEPVAAAAELQEETKVG